MTDSVVVVVVKDLAKAGTVATFVEVDKYLFSPLTKQSIYLLLNSTDAIRQEDGQTCQ
jgi:hypothetical protein